MESQTHPNDDQIKAVKGIEKSDSIASAPVSKPFTFDLEQAMKDVMEGDQSSLLALYDCVSTPLYSMAFTMLKKEDHACEVLQDTFAWVWLNSHKLKQHKGTVFSWLVGLVRQRALTRADKGWPRKALEEYSEKLIPLVCANSESRGINSHSAIQEAFKQLSEKERRVLKLAFFGGFSQQEIASKLGASPGDIRKYATEGLARLRGSIDK